MSGGTFTDFLLTLDDGSSKIYKVLSTPQDPSIGTLNGLMEMASHQNSSLEEFLGTGIGYCSWNHRNDQCRSDL